MKHLLSIGIFLFCFAKIKANHPPPDYLIIGNDTSYIYMRPLDKLDSVTQKLYYQNLKRYFTLNAYPVSIWGYYPAYWQLIDNKLFLVGIKGVSNVDSILQATFPKHYDNGKVFAYWFSSFLTIPKGKILKKDVYSYTRTYFREELFKFENGKLHSRKIIRNYIDLKNGITRLNYEIISDSIFNRIKRLNWKILSDSGCDCTYSININEAGKIGTITYWKSTPEKENDTDSLVQDFCITKFKERLRSMQFDIIKWNGQPYKEDIYFHIFYTVDNELLNWSYH